MKMKLRKEVKHSVVYETDDPQAAVRSVYVMKDWLVAEGGFVGGKYAAELDLEIKVPT